MTNRVVAFVSSRSRREQLIIGVLAVFLVIVAAVVALSGGGGSKSEGGDVGPRLSPHASATPTITSTSPPISAGGFEGRDPFVPLVVEGTGGTGTGGTGSGSSGGPTGPNPTGGQQRVTLIDIFTEDGARMATVQVGDEQFTVGEGETFADNFQVVTITRQCATFLFGDERFTLCIGQEVRK